MEARVFVQVADTSENSLLNFIWSLVVHIVEPRVAKYDSMRFSRKVFA